MRWMSVVFIFAAASLVGSAQESSVRPGINDSFKNPNVKEWQTKFEGESREVYDKRKQIVAACKVKPGQTVADIGAGTGLFTRLFAEEVKGDGGVYAVDISQKFLDHIGESAKKHEIKTVKTVLGTDVSPQLPNASVDVAFICDAYHHFEFPERMMTSLHKSLKHGGRVVVVDFARIPGKSSEWVLKHVRAGQDIVEKEIASCGFRKVDEVEGILSENYFLIFEKIASTKNKE